MSSHSPPMLTLVSINCEFIFPEKFDMILVISPDHKKCHCKDFMSYHCKEHLICFPMVYSVAVYDE